MKQWQLNLYDPIFIKEKKIANQNFLEIEANTISTLKSSNI